MGPVEIDDAMITKKQIAIPRVWMAKKALRETEFKVNKKKRWGMDVSYIYTCGRCGEDLFVVIAIWFLFILIIVIAME